jgi:hypothetical protein
LYPELDTIEVKVTIFECKMKFEPQFSKDSVAYNTIKIDSILNARLVDFLSEPSHQTRDSCKNAIYTSCDS